METKPKSELWKDLLSKGARFAGAFYGVGAGCVEKLTRPFKPILSTIARRASKRPEVLGVELFVALSLTVSFFFIVRPGCRLGLDGDAMPKAVFNYLASKTDPTVRQDIPPSWRMRLAGPITAGWLLDMTGVTDTNESAFENVFGLYHATWLFLLFLLLIFYRQDALLIMFGIMGGLMYYLSDPVRPQFYVWDIATMFFFTLPCLLYSSRRMWLLMLVIWIGALFKETTLCCALLIFLGEQWPIKKRIFGFITTVVLTMASYKLLMWHYHMSGRVLAMNHATSTHDLFWKSDMVNNLHVLFSFDPRHVLFANAGGLFLMLLVPWKNRKDVIFKLLIITYVVGEFFWGIINEFRIWYEVLPLGWMIVSDAWFRERTAAEVTAAGKQASRIWKGSYWLMMSALLVVAAGLCIATKPHLPKPNENEATHLSMPELLLAAAQDNANAQYRLGVDYENGLGIKKDPNEAAHWYQQAADGGSTEAQLKLGMQFVGQGDYTNAALWLGRAAEAGDANSQCSLAALYFRGLGVEKNDAIALEWFQKSARQGMGLAQQQVGRAFGTGHGVKQDYVIAYQWLKLAQLQGIEGADNEVNACAALMTPEQIAEAEKLVQNFKPEEKPSPQ